MPGLAPGPERIEEVSALPCRAPARDARPEVRLLTLPDLGR